MWEALGCLRVHWCGELASLRQQPTAGLHLTPSLLTAMRAAGVEVATLTLHVGPGTFMPVRTDDLDVPHAKIGEEESILQRSYHLSGNNSLQLVEGM